MDTLLSSDQMELEGFCQKLLEGEWPLEKAIRAFGPGGTSHSPPLWSSLVDAGWLGFPFSAALGGAEGDLVDLGLIYRAAGENLVPHSYYSAMFAGLLVDKIGTEAQKQSLLAAQIAGKSIMTVAFAEPHAVDETRLYQARAARVGDHWVLSGTKSFVAELGSADQVLVLAGVRKNSEHAGWGLFAVDAKLIGDMSDGGQSKGIRAHRTSALGGVPLYQIDLNGLEIPADALLGGEEALATTLASWQQIFELATALQCMEMVGGIQSLLRRTVGHVSEREQFGRPIGQNQAVQHMLADIAMRLDGARVAALKALFLVVKGLPSARAISNAKVAIGEGYVNATLIAHQVWGSMGYARETGIYLFAERAKLTDSWMGTRATHLKRVADLMGL